MDLLFRQKLREEKQADYILSVLKLARLAILISLKMTNWQKGLNRMNTPLSLRELQLEKLRLQQEELRRLNRLKLYTYYPDEGPLRRELYPKHMEFFRVGAEFRERCFMAANRIGKTEGAGGYETALHLTGLYPDWWEGSIFDSPVNAWAAGKTNETTRDIVQNKLFGPVKGSGPSKRVAGTGLIPGELIGDISWKAGVPDLIDSVEIKHSTGEYSLLGLKSYQQGRGAFEGTEKDFIWLDEEPPMEIYTECLIRTATTDGLIYMTFTPLDGMTNTVLQFIPDGMKLK